MTATADHIITGDDEQVAALDIQHHAARQGWGDVSPSTQQRIRFRDTMREAVVQKRGPVFFAVAHDAGGHPHCIGPHASKIGAARAAVDASRVVKSLT